MGSLTSEDIKDIEASLQRFDPKAFRIILLFFVFVAGVLWLFY
jgi:hypothetical protein